jgi:hypothetical protein
LFALRMMYTSIIRPFQQVMQMGVEAAGIERARMSLLRMAGSAEEYVEIMEAMRETTRGTVRDTDLVGSAFKMLSLGIADTAENAALMARNVTLLAGAIGQVPSPAAAMQVFALMMANQSKMRLDAFGLSIGEVDKRIEHLTETLDISAEEAWNVAIIELMNEKVELLGLNVENTATKVNRMNAMFGNFADNVKMMMAPLLEDFIDILTGSTGDLDDLFNHLKIVYVSALVGIRGSLMTVGEGLNLVAVAAMAAKSAFEGNTKAFMDFSAEAVRLSDRIVKGLVMQEVRQYEVARHFKEMADEAGAAGPRIAEGMDEGTESILEQEEALAKLISVAQSWDAEMSRHAAKMGEILNSWQQQAEEAYTDHAEKLDDIMQDYVDKVGGIEDEAFKKRNIAIDNYNTKMANLQQSLHNRLLQAEQRHTLRMRQAQDSFRLSQTQSEEQYLYERSRLIAEGDTLGVQELDERHEIEQRMREENFALQQQQQEAMFRQQLEFMKIASAEQAKAIAEALAAQLEAIEENRKEQLEEEAVAQEESAAQEEEAYAELSDSMREKRQEDIDSENASHQQKLTNLAQMLEEYARKNEFGLDEVVNAWQQRYGPGGPMDSLLQSAFQRYMGYVNTFVQQAQAAVSGLTDGWMGRYGGRTRGPRITPTREPHYGQYGGDWVTTKPTSFMSSESGQPERVSITPLSPIGGALTLSWKGAPIQLHGSGSMGGADMSAATNAITRGIVVELMNAFGSYRGERGF